MKRFVLIFSIGPVQPFLKMARTVRDLAYGSWLLSELAKAAAKALYDQGAALIFPAPQNPEEDLKPDSPLNVSNRVLAVIEGEPKEWAEAARNAVMKHLNGEIQRAFEHAENEREWNLIFPEIVHKRTRQQIEDLLEMYWAAAPYPEGTEGAYPQAREQALWTLDLRKNTRDFEPWEGILGVPKSALDGFREAVVVVKGPSNQNSRKIQRYASHPDVEVLEERPPILREGEALSGVDLFKRLGGYAFKAPKTVYDGVPSTSDVAAWPLIVRIGKDKAEQWHQQVIQRLQKLGVSPRQASSETPGVYFFVDRAADLITDEGKYERQRQFRQVFEQDWDAMLGKDTPRPHPYYALLVADGDSMGALIDTQKSEKAHRTLSRKMAGFARQAASIVVKHQGYPIYTGGDDVLALLPLHTVLEALEALDQAFGEAMRDFVHPNTGGTPTLSGGLVIAHHLTPLEDVLTTAREAEAYAKEKPDKHGLTVVLLRRGGEVVRVRDTWPALVEHIRFWAALGQRGLFPRGLPYDLQQLAEFLEPTGLPSEGYQAEVKRVFKQKRERKDETAWAALEHKVNVRFQSDQGKHPAQLLLQMAYEMRLALEVTKAREIAQREPYSLQQQEAKEAAA